MLVRNGWQPEAQTAASCSGCARAAWLVAAPRIGGLSSESLQAMEKAIRARGVQEDRQRLGRTAREAGIREPISMEMPTRCGIRARRPRALRTSLVGIAIGEKKLSGVDARVLALLPERARKMQNPDPRKDKITVEDFLTMSSPLECDDWNDASRGNEERMYVVEDWAQFILDLPVRGRMHVGEKVEPPAYGRYFSYCTGGVFILSEVLAKTTGMRTDRYAQEKVFRASGDHRRVSGSTRR